MVKVEVRRPKQEEREELNQFFSLVIKDTFLKEGISDLVYDMEEEIETKNQYLQADFDSNGRNRYFLIAATGDKIIGTIAFGSSNSLIQECSKGDLTDVIEIGTVYIHPDYQNRGIGTLLLNTMLLTLMSKGIEEFCLDSGYKNAQKIWRKKLGEPDYWMKNYWGEGSDHMIWHRLLKEIPVLFTI
ncbi:GNAT family N-acetyltransferase [Neobacillus sp. LXY-1]|uniref:GNAT family N-acetyltransferase n=1 Tax=Neobacillus sp. LXY-1 TaxID=3379133 RepID=UPI003EE24BF2